MSSIDDFIPDPDYMPKLTLQQAWHLARDGTGKYIKFNGEYDSLFKYHDNDFVYYYSKNDVSNLYEFVELE